MQIVSKDVKIAAVLPECNQQLQETQTKNPSDKTGLESILTSKVGSPVVLREDNGQLVAKRLLIG